MSATAELCTFLEWDTEFWGVRIARVDGEVLTEEGATRVDEWARRNGIACVYFLALAGDMAAAHTAERAGFRLMDVRVELGCEPEAGTLAPGVRESRPADVPALSAIARVSHRGTRFYADPRFPNPRCDDLYGVWIERSCAGWADVVLVADHENRPAGYVSCHIDEARGAGSIGLIAVAEAARRRGLGRSLVESALAWCAARGMQEVSVVTQGGSARSLRLYEACGFRIHSVGLWFHNWYDR